ncbi:MAG: phosphoglycerate dehydrogenase [Eubacteriales bacterium]|mgnify:CR=1 FL=1|nr:phosphoglycerate dehydrogenase [Eubacteriales bacterium]
MKKKVKLLNKIAAVGTNELDLDYYEVGADIESPDAIMVRSAAMHDMTFEPEMLAIARCGAGVNNIPVDRCSKEGIVVFNTPGANANGVKELTLCALFLASRRITDGIEWAKTLAGDADAAKTVEKGKSAFAGTEVQGKKLGVIGLGAIGGMVANAALHLGMEVMGCDPYLSVEAAWSLSRNVKRAASYEQIFRECDYITLHIPATPETKNTINADAISVMKDGVKIINLARADLVDAEALKAGLAAGKVSAYVTDFPTPEIIGVSGVVAIPHLGASTEEAEDNCAVMAAHELDDYLRFGNIKNSVNFPNVSMPHSGDVRICLLHSNVPSIISQITAALSEQHINIENMINKSKGDNAYTLLEINGSVSDSTVAKIKSIEGMYRVRVIQ